MGRKQRVAPDSSAPGAEGLYALPKLTQEDGRHKINIHGESILKAESRQTKHLRGLELELEALDENGNEDVERYGFVDWDDFKNGLLCGGGGPFIESQCANFLFGFAIVCQAVFIGVETDFRQRVKEGQEPWEAPQFEAWFIVESCFLVVFIIELALRLRNTGSALARINEMDRKEEKSEVPAVQVQEEKNEVPAVQGWMIFDTLLVVIGVFDSWVLQSGVVNISRSGVFIRALRLVRLLRVLRIIRLLRFFKELRLLVRSIVGAIQLLIWPFLLIILVLYISAVLVTNLIGKSRDVAEDHAGSEIAVWFGSIGSSAFTLFQIMTLEEWPRIVRTVALEEQFAFLFFVPFMMFMNFAMMNVITAVVVEKVFAIARTEAAESSRREERKRKQMLRTIKQLFDDIDDDGNAALELHEFREATENPAVMQQLMNFGIAKFEASDLFACLDLDGDQTLSVVEFVEGCLRVHGVAQSKHLLQVQYDIVRNRESLRFDLEELDWYVRWVIRHLAFRFKWHRGNYIEAPPTSHTSPTVGISRITSTVSSVTASVSGGDASLEVSNMMAIRASSCAQEAPTDFNVMTGQELTDEESQDVVNALKSMRDEQVSLRRNAEALLGDVRKLRCQFASTGFHKSEVEKRL